VSVFNNLPHVDLICWFKAVTGELNWLKFNSNGTSAQYRPFNSQPWTEVMNKWRKTSVYSIKCFEDGSKSVNHFKLLLKLKKKAGTADQKNARNTPQSPKPSRLCSVCY